VSDFAYVAGLESPMMQEWRRKSRNLLYQTDPEAWLWDVLGKKWWSKQREIAWSFVHNEFTIVKSANGVGKTQLAGDLVSWFVSVFEPTETRALVSAPVRSQIDENMFNYLRANYQVALDRKLPLLGEITRWPKWVVHTPYENDVVIPKRPSDQNLLSSFQGLHFRHMAVVLDEAGGLQEDFYIGANAVTTNEDAHVLAIGNPDRRNTAFHERFKSALTPDSPLLGEPTDEQIDNDDVYIRDGQWYLHGDKYRDWHRFTIGFNDTPNATGEKIYPDDPERDKAVKSDMTQVRWAQMMRRSASAGVIAAKVDGEFPDESDNAFFTQAQINKAWNTYAFLKALVDAGEMPFEANRWLGVDVAFSGEDKNVITSNYGGKLDVVDKWGKEEGEEAVEDMAIARRVHRWAMDLGVTQVRIDAAGTSRGVHSNLKTEAEFTNRRYTLIGIVGSNASPNNNRWINARAWHYDQMRDLMTAGTIGIDPAEVELRTDLEVQTFKHTLRQQLQMTSKADLKKDLKRSPDYLDSAIYASIDLTGVVDGPAAGLEPGDIVYEDPWDLLDAGDRAGLPI
jgi:hypothetical protein